MDQAEQLRKMMKQQSRPQSVARVITVTSGKGGVGKSSIAVNLAIQISKLDKRVVIFDADFGLANIEVMLGIRPQFNLADLMFHGKGLKDVITEGPCDIGFISGGSGIQELAHLNREQIIFLSQKLAQLDEYADYIIVDTGAGISDSVLEFAAASSEVLLVATPEPTSITDAYALLKTLNRRTSFHSGDTRIRMIANRVKNETEGEELYKKLNLVVDKFLMIPIEYLGCILQDSNMPAAIMKQKPVTLLYPTSSAARSINTMMERLLIPTGKDEVKRKGIVQLFSGLLKAEFKKKRS